MRKIKRIFRAIKKILFDSFIKATFIYTKYYDKLTINENEMIFQSFDGTSISGNVYYMLLEINKDTFYDNYQKYVVCNKSTKKNIERFLKSKNVNKNIELVKIHSRKYCKILATSKYLINNSTFPSYYIKKEGQVYINTWHGTPLKAMGRNIKSSPNELGNTQRNFFMADYLIYQNDFMFEKMRKDYMLDNFYQGEYLLSGYPRNDIFYNNESRIAIKEELGIQNKKVIIYMPTWRGTLKEKENEEQYHYIMNMLTKIDNEINKDTVMYVKLHNYVTAMIDFTKFKNIKRFPNNYETYEFLNIADILVTDYSSVFFDFANTGKRIVLFAYDKNEYLKDRGMYLEYDKLPFDIVEKVEELLEIINKDQNQKEYFDFQKRFCNYDSISTTKNVCDYIFKKNETEKIKIIQGKDFCNNKENVLIFGGALLRNGITTALKGIFKNVDLTNRNYVLTFFSSKVEKNKKEINFFKDTDYIPIQGRRNATISEYVCSVLFFYFNINTNYIKNKVDNIFKRELKRIYPNMCIDHAIHFSGYEKNVMHLFKNLESKKTIFVHNDLSKELKSKSNIHKNSLLEVYKKFDNIVLIRESLINSIKPFLNKEDYGKIKLIHNFNNIEVILEMKDKEIKFSETTYSNISLEKLNKILNDKNSRKFINIARFSKEKGLDRLIKAFDTISIQNENVYLIIIGGYGKQFEEIKKLVKKSSNRIILIQDLENPYPILYKSDCFILSSYYEGLPMTIMEALILDKKVISTNIEGPKEFLEKGYGYLVDNSQEGLTKGMNDFLNNKLNNLKQFDAQEFNNKALKEFEELFK